MSNDKTEVKKLRLNMGCGIDRKDGYINCDFVAAPGVDMVVDLEKPLYQWPDNSVDEIYCSHVLEHIIYWERTVNEFHRILKPNGILEVRVPYGYDWGTGHVRPFFPQAFDSFLMEFNHGSTSLEAKPLFRLISRKYHYTIPFRWHIGRYLGIWLKPWYKYGIKRRQITWILEKNSLDNYGNEIRPDKPGQGDSNEKRF